MYPKPEMTKNVSSLRVAANLKDLASKPELEVRAHTYTIYSQITKEGDGNDAGTCASEYKQQMML